MIERLREKLVLLARDSESGAAMVEFAVVFPVQLVLTLALIQFAFLAQAHMVVQHAAFAGARAEAVADGMIDRTTNQPIPAGDAAKRSAARVLATLTAGAEIQSDPAGLGTQPAIGLPTNLRWNNTAGGNQVHPLKQQEAYSLMRIELGRTDNAVGVVVQYDYVMAIPVAAWLFAKLQGIPEADRVQLGQGLHPWRIRRKAYISTPWRAHPSTTSATAVTATAVGQVPAVPDPADTTPSVDVVTDPDDD